MTSIWVCAYPNRCRAETAANFRIELIEPRSLLGNAKYPRADYDMLGMVMICRSDADSGPSEGMLGMVVALLATGVGVSRRTPHCATSTV